MAEITAFLNQKSLAIVGVSRSEKKFSNVIYRVLKSKGYQVFAVNPHASIIGGETCYTDIQSIPQKIGGIVIVVSPDQTDQIVKDAITVGIKNVWIQQGAESPVAIDLCKQSGVNVIQKQCILMYAEPNAIHKCHRFLWKLLGKLPK